MLEGFKEPVQVVFIQSIAGLPDRQYGLDRPFSFQPGDSVLLPAAIAKLWQISGVCKRADQVSPAELIDLKITGAK